MPGGLLIGALCRQPPSAFSLTYSSSADGSNLWSDAVTAGYAGEDEIIVTVNSGVQLGSTSTATPGMTIDTTYSGKTINFTNNGTINGRGGAGGAGGSGAGGSTGGTGGVALYVHASFSGNINFTNQTGAEINGGGGGGGGGAGGRPCNSEDKGNCQGCSTTSGGNGGLGYGNAAAASGGSGVGPNGTPCQVTTGAGGAGGGKGATGTNGSNNTIHVGNCGPCPGYSGGSGGSAGAAIDGISKISLTNNGTINGSQIN